MTLEDRFWVKVDKDGPVPAHRPDLGACWIWLGATNGKGYGQIRIGGRDDGRLHGAHRIAFTMLVGPIAEGLVPDHLCLTTLCVNPAHLELVTHRENTLRGNGPTALRARQTHCQHGHPLSGDNLVVQARTGYRGCRICINAAKRRYYHERKHAA